MAVSKRLRFEILKRDNYACRYCGATPPEVKLTIDHVVPVSLGGTDDPSNLCAACTGCNGGKSSAAPDAPLVADVAQDALRWSKAIAVVAQERMADRETRQQRYDAFEKHWNTWTHQGKWLSSGGYEQLTFPLPGGWRSTVDQFIEAGLELEELYELVDVAMGARSTDEWRYFCGCCWKRIRQIQERAAEIAQQYVLSLEAIEETDRPLSNDFVLECEDHSDGLCANDTLCQIVAATRTREVLDSLSMFRFKEKRRAESINDAAEEAEGYVYG